MASHFPKSYSQIDWSHWKQKKFPQVHRGSTNTPSPQERERTRFKIHPLHHFSTGLTRREKTIKKLPQNINVRRITFWQRVSGSPSKYTRNYLRHWGFEKKKVFDQKFDSNIQHILDEGHQTKVPREMSTGNFGQSSRIFRNFRFLNFYLEAESKWFGVFFLSFQRQEHVNKFSVCLASFKTNLGRIRYLLFRIYLLQDKKSKKK